MEVCRYPRTGWQCSPSDPTAHSGGAPVTRIREGYRVRLGVRGRVPAYLSRRCRPIPRRSWKPCRVVHEMPDLPVTPVETRARRDCTTRRHEGSRRPVRALRYIRRSARRAVGHPQGPGMEVHIGMRIDFANGHAFAKGIERACRAVDDGKRRPVLYKRAFVCKGRIPDQYAAGRGHG